MSAGGSDGTADRPAARDAGGQPQLLNEDRSAGEEGPSQAGCSLPAVELPRKRKGDVEERSDTHVQQSLDFQMEDDLSRSEEEDQQAKMKCFREPHSQIEKRRRDKMNNLIDELSAMIPACQPMARKLDKLTVLRKAVQHLKALKAGPSSTFIDTTYKPSVLPHDDLRHLLLKVADGFLLVVSCDRAKILFISESVSKILNFSRFELTGQSLFDFIHPKDINKVKEQLASSELHPRQRLIDAATGAPIQTDSPVRPSHLTSGTRRSFFCRMKHSRVTGKHEDKHVLPGTSKKKDTYRYLTLHCTGYMRSWPSSQLDSDADTEKETSNLTCLVMVCCLLPHTPQQPSKDIRVKPTEFVTRCATDGKFTFVDQRRSRASRWHHMKLHFLGSNYHTFSESFESNFPYVRLLTVTCGEIYPALTFIPLSLIPFSLTGTILRDNERDSESQNNSTSIFYPLFPRATTVIGYLPQEILGTSCYEYFHQDDLQHLAEKHRQALRSKEKIETSCYKFKTKYGPYVSLQSQWFSFTNPWTKEVEFIVSLNRVVSGPGHTLDEGAGSSRALQEDTKQIPIIPGLSSGVGTMIYAGSIGTQIANELIDSYRMNSSPSSGASSPFASAQEKLPLVSPQTSRSASSREEASGSSSQSQSDSGTAAGTSIATSESTGEPPQLDLDTMVPGLSSFSSDEAAMAVIMSLLETDVNMGQSGDFDDLHWPF